MGLPVAVAPTVRTPGFYLLLNLLAGIASPGLAVRRALLVACKSTAGDITNDTEVRQSVAGPDAVSTALGPGMPGHLAAKRLFEEYPLAQLDVVAPTSPAGVKATGTVTFTQGSTAPTSARTVTIGVCGREFVYLWGVGEDVTTVAANGVLAINALAADIPVVATSALGVLTLTAKDFGTWGNDVTIWVTVTGGAPADATAAASGANLTGGTLEANPATALSSCAGREYDLIIMACNGNTDSNTAASTSAISRALTYVLAHNSGLNAMLQQILYGTTGSLTNAKVGTAYQNSVWEECVHGRLFQSLPAELAGFEAGQRLREESIDPVVNRIGMVAKATLYGPVNMLTGPLTAAETEDALQSGVSPLAFDSSGNVITVRPITTHFKDSAGNPDNRCLDIGQTNGGIYFAKDLRVTVPQEFQGAHLSPDLTDGDEPLAPGTVEASDVKVFVISRARALVRKGVLDSKRISEAVANGEFVVAVDDTDPTQCNILVPERTVAPLAKFSTVINAS